MRTIKFRAWNKELKYMLVEAVEFREDRVKNTTLGGNWEWMQFTGLTDKNGKEIYEGDIVYAELNRFKYIVKLGRYFIYNVDGDQDWQNGFYIESKMHSKFDPYEGIGESDKFLVVIGNIYENSDLLTD